MHVIHRRGWELREREATPEYLFFNRRSVLAGAGAVAAAALVPGSAEAQRRSDLPDPTASLYPVKRNAKYMLDRPVTDEAINITYNNFYEFGSSKTISRAAQALRIRPWTIKLDGLVEKPMEIGIDDLLKRMPLEERLYRHRCVEAWAMAVPWSGFPFAKLVELARPLSSATYVRMETFLDPSVASGQRQTWYPWPYTEGLTLAEATNDLAFLVTGAYGKPLPKSMGAPLRLAVPWKYGFKSIKSIVRFTFTDRAAQELLGAPAGERVRLLGERQSRRAPSALESGEREPARHGRAAADPIVQRLRRIRRAALQRAGARTAVGVKRLERAGFRTHRVDPAHKKRRTFRPGAVVSILRTDTTFQRDSRLHVVRIPGDKNNKPTVIVKQ